jgi:6,7-dimethyl-8-ribityllumazine synthase
VSARYAIVISQFNPEVTLGLLQGARSWLATREIAVREEDVIEAPGAFELPLLAQALAKTGRYSGVICLGCVIKGDTAHFEFISLATSIGIQTASLSTGVPIAFGVLTTYTEEQAQARSKPDAENKGIEAAQACVLAAEALERIRTQKQKPKQKQKRNRKR